jgi:hypothetical protein
MSNIIVVGRFGTDRDFIISSVSTGLTAHGK